MELIVRYARVKALPVYTCSNCKTKATGSTVDREFKGDPLDIASEVASMEVSNQHMPIGWSSAYGKGHRCPTCAKEQ